MVDFARIPLSFTYGLCTHFDAVLNVILNILLQDDMPVEVEKAEDDGKRFEDWCCVKGFKKGAESKGKCCLLRWELRRVPVAKPEQVISQSSRKAKML